MGQVTRFPIYYNLILAFGAALSALSYSLAFDLSSHDFSIVLLLFGTLAVYNLHRLIKYKRGDYSANLPLKNFCNKHYVLLALTVMFAGFSSLMVIAKETIASEIIQLMLVCGFLALLYPLRILPWKGNRYALRELPYIKPYLVGLVWAVLIVMVRPKIGNNENISFYGLALAAAFLQFFLITSISDIKDVQVDLPQTKTLPQILKKRKFQLVVAVVSILLLFTLSVAAWLQQEWTIYHTAFLLSWIYLAMVGVLATKNRSVYFFGYLVDGMPVVQFLLILLLTGSVI